LSIYCSYRVNTANRHVKTARIVDFSA